MNRIGITTASGDARRTGGSALVIALWTIALLSLLVMSFALDALLEGRVSVYLRQRRRVDHLTQSGAAIAEMLLEKQQTVSAGSLADDEQDRWRETALRIQRGQTAVVEEEIGDGVVRVEIIPEPARWNINALVGKEFDEVWEQIFTLAGIPQDRFSELIDSWNDWVDPDSIPARDGAEDDFYMSLDPPYRPRNQQVDTVDELRLIKGFVPAILDGGALNPEERNKERQIVVQGIKELFTTYGDGKINVNAAPIGVLKTIPGIDEIMAGAIVEEREGFGQGASSSGAGRGARLTPEDEEDFSFKSEGDFISRIPGVGSGVSRFISVRSGTFRIIIEGRAAGISHVIQAIAELDGPRVRYLRWREDP